MGMFDTMNQNAKSGVTGMTGTMGPGMNTQGNGGSFAQKMQMRANPVMQGRPNIQNRPTGGARPMRPQINPVGVGAGGPRPQGIGGSYNQLLQANPAPMQQVPAQPMQQEQPQSGLNPLRAPGDIQPQVQSDNPFAAVGQSAQIFGEPAEDMGSRDPREILRMKMMQGGGRPDVMPRTSIGPSDELRVMGQPMQPVVMDENGLEPRRGAR